VTPTTARIISIDRPTRKRYYDVTLDRGGVVKLSPEILAQTALRPGQELSEDQLRDVQEREARYRAMTGALRLLSYRQRSEKEIRDALRRRSTPEDVVEETISRLQSVKFIDDSAFATNYVEARDGTSPRGKRLLAAELAARGIGKPEREQSLSSVDETDAAYRAGQKRARSLASAAFPDFQRRLSDLLRRRGFSYDTARRTVQRLWSETHSEDPSDPLVDD
jgi:regulatory protein